VPVPDQLPTFRMRGTDVSRIEGFSDAVFALALTLLIVSLDVPRDFQALMTALRSFPGFAFAFMIFGWIWISQYRYFRRYGLHDMATIVLMLVLVFMVLFYVYPLKYLNGALFDAQHYRIPDGQLPSIFVLYGLGFAAVSAVLMLLFLHAYRLREVLELHAVERLQTVTLIVEFALVGAVGVLSALISLLNNELAIELAGFGYFVIPLIYLFTYRWRVRRTRQLASDSSRAAPVPDRH
jgi:uncharacterized membrane protein